MDWTKALTRALVVTSAVAVSSCGESPDDAYQRGYDAGWEDGANAVCDAVERISPAVERRLGGERLC